MVEEISPEQFWKLYKHLPQELRDAIFAEETAEHIGNICERNEVADEKISEIVRYIGQVLLGLLPPNEFPQTLEEKLFLEKEIAKRVAHEIYRFIFAPVKDSLAELYGTKASRPEEITTPTKEKIPETISPDLEKEKEEIYRWLESEKREPPSSKEDIYREPLT